MFGTTVGAGFSDATACLIGMMGSGSTNARVNGLTGLSSGMPSRGLRHRALKPLLGTRRPALVMSPIFIRDRKSTRLNSSHGYISYAVFCLKKKKKIHE